MDIYIVKPGDTPQSVAQNYGIPTFVLEMLNNLGDLPGLVVGQALLVLIPQRYHTVQSGETLTQIAQNYGVNLNTLFRNNPNLKGASTIYLGQTLVIEFERNPIRSIEAYGYVYPYVDKELLATILPYSTSLAPFTYGITEEGGLVQLDDAELIALAQNYGVTPLMHLSTLTEQGGFSNELASLVLNNEDIQDKLIDEIIANMQQKGYTGLDIDFEFVFPQDSLLYGEFIGKLRSRLDPLGYPVIAALAILIWFCAFTLQFSAWIFGLAGTILAILSIFVSFDSIVNGCIILFTAFLVSPFGLPMLAAWMIGQMQRFRYFVQDTIYG